MKALNANGREITVGQAARLAMAGYTLSVTISQVDHQRTGTLVSTVSGVFRHPRSLFAERVDEVASFPRLVVSPEPKQEKDRG